MKVVILAGGLGTRLSERTDRIPKPMVEIGGRPIVWHVMKHYAQSGFTDFTIALGYLGEIVKRYFVDYHRLSGNLVVNLESGVTDVERHHNEDWTVRLLDTGADTNTGGRVERVLPALGREPFLLTYCDGVSDVDLAALVNLHRESDNLVTLTAVRPPARFGGLELDGHRVSAFTEKPQVGEGWINGGFMVVEPEISDYLEGDETSFEYDALERVAEEGRLGAYKHEGYWQCMDTLRELRILQELWRSGNAPWRTWKG